MAEPVIDLFVEKENLFETFLDSLDTSMKTISPAIALIGNNRVKTTIAAIGACAAIARTVYDWNTSRRNPSYTITVYDYDPLYEKVQEVLLASIPSTEVYDVVAGVSISGVSTHDTDDGLFDALSDEDPNETEKRHQLQLLYSGNRSEIITFGGVRVRAKLVRATSGAQNQSNDRGSNVRANVDYINIECANSAARDAVLIEMSRMTHEITEVRPSVFAVAQWGNFRRIGDVPNRPLDTVVLKDGQADRILSDLKNFLGKRDVYERLGMPFRRGILLEGAPGTGKSSVATALAHELGMSVYIITISSIENDSTLLDLVGEIRRGSIILLEDIDIATAVRERTDEKSGVTMSGILNALDGIATPQDVITILTTNNAEVIDKAVIRPGRVDIREKIGYIDNDQLLRLCEVLNGRKPEGLPFISEDDKIVAASVVECFKRNLEDQDAAEKALYEMIVGVKDSSTLKDNACQITE